MSAIENWKRLYKSWHNIDFTNGIVFRSDFYSIRREAALERIIERQRRDIERLTFRAREVEAALDAIAETLGINDRLFNPIIIYRGDVIDGGKVIVTIDQIPF